MKKERENQSILYADLVLGKISYSYSGQGGADVNFIVAQLRYIFKGTCTRGRSKKESQEKAFFSKSIKHMGKRFFVTEKKKHVWGSVSPFSMS